jgi:hypothetical protein
VLQLLRQAGTPSWQSIWAEDGSVYATDALNMSPAATLFRGYAGYVQFLPRVLALSVRLVPVRRASVVLAVLASLCCALLALFVYRSTERWIDSTALRLVAAATVALLPASYLETTANIANLGWPLLVATFWAILSRHESMTDTGLRCVVVALTALSTTVAVLLAPLALGAAWYRRRRRDWAVAAAFGVALAVQLALDRSAGPSPPRSPNSTADIPEVFGVRVLGSIAFGERWLGTVWSSLHFWLIPLAILLISIVVLRAARDASRERRWFAVAGLGFAFVLFAVPVWMRGTGFMHLSGESLNINAPRYVIAPTAVAFSALLVVVDATRRRWLRYVVVAQAAFVMAICFRMPSVRSDAEPWGAEVDRAAQQCRDQPTLTLVRLPISPGPPWTVVVPCERVR